MTTVAEAYDAACAIINTAWTAAGAVTASLPLEWDDVKGDLPGRASSTAKRSKAFGRVTFNPVAAPDAILGGRRRRFDSTGLLTIQVFAPAGGGHSQQHAMAQVVLDALRTHVGSVSGVWFTDITPPQRIGRTGDHDQANVDATLNWQELVTT